MEQFQLLKRAATLMRWHLYHLQREGVNCGSYERLQADSSRTREQLF